MKLFLLADTLVMAGLFALGFTVIALLMEALVLFLFKLNRFGKCLIDALMANIGSVLLGVLLFLVFNKMEFEGVSELNELIIFYFITSIFETWIIKLLNPTLGWTKILLPVFVMNLLTFGGLYLLLSMGIFF